MFTPVSHCDVTVAKICTFFFTAVWLISVFWSSCADATGSASFWKSRSIFLLQCSLTVHCIVVHIYLPTLYNLGSRFYVYNLIYWSTLCKLTSIFYNYYLSKGAFFAFWKQRHVCRKLQWGIRTHLYRLGMHQFHFFYRSLIFKKSDLLIPFF